MPTFGDYETVGEPLAVINLQGHSSTVWKVQKHGAPTGTGARVEWVVKCYSPHRKSQAGGDEQSLNRDRGLEFLEGIKQLKKVQSEGGRHLTPIHDLGISPEGVWYVTDHYPRSSLQALIGRRAKVDGAALKQIIRCIVAGCLVLKLARWLCPWESEGEQRIPVRQTKTAAPNLDGARRPVSVGAAPIGTIGCGGSPGCG